MSPVEKEAARIIADRILSTVEIPSDLALLSPARVAGMLDMPAPELQRFIAPVRLGHRTIRYRVSDVKHFLARHLGARSE